MIHINYSKFFFFKVVSFMVVHKFIINDEKK